MNKVIEYLAFGRPMVAFDLCENHNTAGRCAMFVEPNSEIKMGEELRALVLDEAMGSTGRERFRALLSGESSEKELISLYTELLDSPSDNEPKGGTTLA
jgi:glycosyltransferase involved in cell wall biosynthesis